MKIQFAKHKTLNSFIFKGSSILIAALISTKLLLDKYKFYEFENFSFVRKKRPNLTINKLSARTTLFAVKQIFHFNYLSDCFPI